MRFIVAVALSVIAVLLPASTLVAQSPGQVRVTSARANIRAEASETAAVHLQVVQGTLLELVAVEGDWFKVRVPVSGLRIEAYISKKVSKLETPPTGPASGPPAASTAPPPPVKPAVESRDGMSVAMTVAGVTGFLTPNTARVVEIGDKVDVLSKLAASMPAGDAPPAGASGATPVTFVWVADGATAAKVIDDHHPSFVVEFKDVPGLSPDDLSPMLLRLTPAASGVRVVSAIRGRADQSSRTDADWDVIKDLKQDAIKVTVQTAERGSIKITPVADLPAGQYAVVFRLTAKRKLSGAGVLRTAGEARIFTVLWDFAIQ